MQIFYFTALVIFLTTNNMTTGNHIGGIQAKQTKRLVSGFSTDYFSIDETQIIFLSIFHPGFGFYNLSPIPWDKPLAYARIFFYMYRSERSCGNIHQFLFLKYDILSLCKGVKDRPVTCISFVLKYFFSLNGKIYALPIAKIGKIYSGRKVKYLTTGVRMKRETNVLFVWPHSCCKYLFVSLFVSCNCWMSEWVSK